MKICRLYLKAYGPFTERWLDFDSPGMSIIYGKNEAGKSSTLRALHGFFFGIDHNSSDSFIHEYAKMRIGAVLETATGEVVGLMRRKGRTRTLFRMDPNTGEELTDQPVEESFLSGLLGGLDASLYRALFGLDLQNLVEGSEELLSGQGEVGSSLFQATAGLGNLQTLAGKLDGEAAALFKQGGSVPPLNKALKEIDEKRARVKELGVRTTVWHDKAKALEQAQAEYAAIVDQLDALVQEHTRLQQVRACLPLASERIEVLTRLEELKDVPYLSADFTERRIQAQAAWRNAETIRTKASSEITRLEALLTTLQVNQAIFDHAEPIGHIHHRVGDFQGARRRLPELEEGIKKLHQDVVQALQRMEISADAPLQQLEPTPTLRARVNAHIGDYQTLRTRADVTRKQVKNAEDKIADAKAELAQLPAAVSVGGLDAMHHDISRRGDLEKVLSDTRRQRDELLRKVEQGTALLWTGTVEDLAHLRLPEQATLEDFLGRFTAIEQGLRDLAIDDTKLDKDTLGLQLDQQSLAAAGEVITTEQVFAARERRDEGWQLIQQVYIDRVPDADQRANDYAAGASLSDAFAKDIEWSDHLADRRYQEAERSTKFEEYALRIAHMQAAKDLNARRREQLIEEQTALQQRWEAAVAHLDQQGLTPAAAKDWCQRQRGWREQYDQLATHNAAVSDATNQTQEARGQLADAIIPAGLDSLADSETLVAALNRVRQHLQRATDAAQARRVHESTLKQATADLQSAQREQGEIQEQITTLLTGWTRDMAALRLLPDALPDEARARLGELDQLRELRHQRQAKEDNQTLLRQQVELFEVDALSLLAAVGQGDAAGGNLEDRLGELHQQLAQERATATRKDQAEDNLAREREHQQFASEQQETQTTTLAQLLAQAKVDREDQLPDIEARAAEKLQAEQALHSLNRQLAGAAALPPEQALHLVEGQESAAVATRLQAIDREKRELDERRDNALRARDVAETELKAIDGGAAAADAQEELQANLAKTSRGVHDYLRLKLSQVVVTRVVNAYREQHQGPVLARAGEIFREMTQGSFERLTTDFEGESQVMLGLRPDGTRVSIEGLSTGTRDQLFLSLRLAGIEEHLKTREPVPLIVDDLLVQFDEGRVQQAVEQLANLGLKTQVVLLTHHQHVKKIAAKFLSEAASLDL
jgi:uncharacterized protein YhaN